MGERNGYSRRDFLKIVGTTSGLAVAGCGKKATEKLLPFVVQPDEIIPGVATWYASTCHECPAGCGILVKTREGRAIKIEGNTNHPINRGGLCSRGQSALQTLYDPDRVRQPLVRGEAGLLKPIPWPEAISTAAKAIAERAAEKKVIFLTGTLSGSEAVLVRDFVTRLPNAEHVEFEVMNRDVLDVATERCWGSGSRVHYDLARADLILSIGADYLETWLSPVEFARGWAVRRRPEAAGGLSYCVHIGPRLSLTGANADDWLKSTPDTEVWVLSALLRELLDAGGGSGLKEEQKKTLLAKLNGVNLEETASVTGISPSRIRELVRALRSASSPVVLVGGTAVSGPHATLAIQLGNLLNAALGVVGRTVLVRQVGERATFSSQRIEELGREMEAGRVAVLLVSGTNPRYSLPVTSTFQKGLAKVGTLVSVSTMLDETALLANVVLPLSTPLESWKDSEVIPGVYGLTQPVMQPVFDTQGLLDTLIALGAKLDLTFEDASTGLEYIRARWRRRMGEVGFEQQWVKLVERGGDLAEPAFGGVVPLDAAGLEFQLPQLPANSEAISLLAYPTVHLFDGRSANRPWIQELPDPLTNVVWGSWIEIHPELAHALGVSEGDSLRIQTPQGSVEAPVYITEHIHPRLLAMPIGQGHKSFGRFSVGVGANVLSILSVAPEAGMRFVQTLDRKAVSKTAFGDKLVRPQGHFSQEGRFLARTVELSSLPEASDRVDWVGHGSREEEGREGNHEVGGHRHLRGSGHLSSHQEVNGHGESGGGHHGGPEFGPAPKRPQMYEQMTHPLYRWGMSIDLAACTGCSACVVACYAENNIPVVGKDVVDKSRIMSWIRIDRYFDGPATHPVSGLMPMLCQHCGNAPCEPVCPVYATYHNEQGLNTMVYNRCVGTRYCSNNCSYKVRRFNWWKYTWPEPLTWQLNPDVTVREVGIMEKCTFCVQRIQAAENNGKNLGRPILDGEVEPACASSCPTGAITFGNLLDKRSEVYRKSQSARGYRVLDAELNTQPAITYLARVRNDSVKVS